MNTTPLKLCGLLLALCLASQAQTPLDETPARKSPAWNVRVEVLMVAMPQEKALALLPDLQSPKKIEAAFTEILKAIERKEATLTGYPFVYTVDGQRAVAETMQEKRYPTEFDLPQATRNTAATQTSAPASLEKAVPTTFETRNLGVTLEVEPVVSPSGETIQLSVVPQRVMLLGFDKYDAVKAQSGELTKVDQPLFASMRTTSSLVLKNGQRSLLAVHKLFQPADQLELFIIQAVATPTK